jgi:hypothetical protein
MGVKAGAAKLLFGKDVIYRFKNNPKLNWRSLLGNIGRRHEKEAEKNRDKNAPRTPNALIIDDSGLAKTGSKIEGTSKCHNHNGNTYYIGYKFLTLISGVALVPSIIDFSLHVESYRPSCDKGIDPKTPGGKRRKELNKSKIEVTIEMLKRHFRYST